MRNSHRWRSRPAPPRPGNSGAGTEAPRCSGRRGWSPGRTWSFPISFSQMRPAWRSQCCWSCSSTCECNGHRFPSHALAMGSESAKATWLPGVDSCVGLVQALSSFRTRDSGESVLNPTAALSRVGEKTLPCLCHWGAGSGGSRKEGTGWNPFFTLFNFPSKPRQ